MKKENFPKIIPIFPLSNFIIFPHTTVPLNIFEKRYVDMIHDSLKTTRVVVGVAIGQGVRMKCGKDDRAWTEIEIEMETWATEANNNEMKSKQNND